MIMMVGVLIVISSEHYNAQKTDADEMSRGRLLNSCILFIKIFLVRRISLNESTLRRCVSNYIDDCLCYSYLSQKK